MEGLGDDPGAHAPRRAAAELGLAQDVEPERRVPEERISLRLGEPAEVGAVVAVAGLGLRERRHGDAPVPEEPGHLLGRWRGGPSSLGRREPKRTRDLALERERAEPRDQANAGCERPES
jgi:hypothetical protein